ncbi:hypothetical protein [Bradyrhizobium sp. 141]|uniref:hypothetical protein n=1 Tax=Bradyrhizobium sp. 141 TaxID=2782617 RepID=UPI001FF800A3|nr:hypothetical protein [Bradyrhizobium sp. 141]MCK1720347.1 hypothetical protein [Bradyrhizobium sp. 141]
MIVVSVAGIDGDAAPGLGERFRNSTGLDRDRRRRRSAGGCVAGDDLGVTGKRFQL